MWLHEPAVLAAAPGFREVRPDCCAYTGPPCSLLFLGSCDVRSDRCDPPPGDLGSWLEDLKISAVGDYVPVDLYS